MLLELAKNPWPKAARAWHQWCPGKVQSLLPKGLSHLPVLLTLPTPKSSAQPVLQVCLARSQSGPVPNSFTGRKDVNRGQGAGGGQRRPGSFVCTSLSSEAARITPQGGLAPRDLGTGPPRGSTRCQGCPHLPSTVPPSPLLGLPLAHPSSLTAVVSASGKALPLSLSPGHG